MKKISKTKILIQVLFFLMVVYGSVSPLLRSKRNSGNVDDLFNLYDLLGIKFYFVFIFILVLSIILSKYLYTKTAAIIISLPTFFFMLILWSTISHFVANSKSGSYDALISRGDFSFLGYGWYFIILGLLGLLITFVYKGEKKE